MRPLARSPRAVDCTGAESGITIAGTKPGRGSSSRVVRAHNDRRQFSSSEREMPYPALSSDLQILQDDLELLMVGPSTTPANLINLEPFDLSTALTAVHKTCYTALALT
ncbi:hypothetical protein IVB27_08935 [Bradyrhizobium sp. 197]|uniref:hypothetical protein n=1 Tax=Bradyrhizobium sp. 197 TaxID=2782663 RepID=UPI001FF86A18|nr:hypothetical protein [Bradyrhizobium sp. 197]MCK1474926.1 hypothetical protein [Bradyrhizobium sp. 197]